VFFKKSFSSYEEQVMLREVTYKRERVKEGS
jgi:hypothetical protein